MKSKEWYCGMGHAFMYGDEEWHYDESQGLDEDGYPIPMYCAAYMDDAGAMPCMDSSSLIPQF